MAQSRLITDLVELIQPNNDDIFVIVDNSSDPSLSVTKRISYANLKESLQDMIDLFIAEGNGIVATYDDAGNTITLSVSGDTTIQKSIYSSGGTSIGSRQQLNFIPGAGVTLTGADNPGGNRVDLTVNTTTVATGITLSGTGSLVSPLNSITTLGDGTKQLDFRGIKTGSSKLSVNTGDGGNSIVIDVVPSGIDINSLDVGSPLGVALGGTNATTADNARANLGAAQLGVNNDITSIVGLTTPLSVSQGGTGGNTVQLGLRNLEGIRTVTNVGSVGQSLIVNASTLVSNSYRAELKGIRAGSSKITVSTVGNDISVDANAILILNSATEDINLNGNKVTSLANPSASSDAANKGYVDAVAQGLVVKEAVVAATTVNQAGTYNASGLTFTYTATGTPSIDSVSITATGTRVLFKNQTTASQNGIYALTTSGDTGVSPVFTRGEDYNSSLEASAGSFAFVLSGSVNANKQFVQTTITPTLDTDPLVFTVLNDLSIANSSVTNAKLADMPALRVKGTVTSGAPLDLTSDQLITIVNSGSSQVDAVRLNLSSVTGDVVFVGTASAIASGVVVDADISPTAEIAVSKLADGTARQLLQTSADGNSVEWASDIVVPGTFGVTGQAIFSGNTIFASGTTFVSGPTFSGNTTFASGATFSGNTTFANGTTVFASGATFVQPLVASGTISGGTIIGAAISGGTISGATISGGTIIATLSGNATTATTLQTARTINGVSFDGSSNITIASAAANVLTRGSFLTGNNYDGSAATTWAVDATSTNTASKVVVRDASGNFSAGTITAALTGNASTVTTNANLTGDVTSVGNATSIASNVIVNADVNTAAAIAFSKLANVSATDRLLGRSTAGAGVIEEVVCTAAGRALLDDANNTAQRTTLGLGSIATLTAPAGTVVGTTDTQTLTNKTLTDPAIIGTIIEDVFTITDGAAFEVDPGNGSVQLITLGASRTPKATNFVAGESVTLMVADGTNYALTWTDATWGTGGVKWTGGGAPILATTGFTVLQFWKVSTQVYGAYVGDVA